MRRPLYIDSEQGVVAGLETTEVIMLAIQEWRKNKRECGPDSVPHLADLNTFAHVLGGYIDVCPGRAHILVGPRGTVAELRVEQHPEGPHLLGWEVRPGHEARLHDLFMESILARPIAGKEK